MDTVVIHGTDNILITALDQNGLQTVGQYSNYTLISETLNTIRGLITNALTPSIENLNAEKDSKKSERIFHKSPATYYIRYLLYFVLVLFSFVIADFIVSLLHINGWIGFIISDLAFTIVFNGIFIAFTFNSKSFKYVSQAVTNLMKNFFKGKVDK